METRASAAWLGKEKVGSGTTWNSAEENSRAGWSIWVAVVAKGAREKSGGVRCAELTCLLNSAPVSYAKVVRVNSELAFRIFFQFRDRLELATM